MISLLDLPLETILEVVSYLDTQAITALRSTCPYIYAVLCNTSDKQKFSRLYAMPTKFSLQRLLDTAKDGRMKCFVKELTICCSMYQDRGSYYIPPKFPQIARSNITSWPRISRDDETPFRNPASPEQEVTNEAVNFVREGCFEKELTTALQALDVTSVEIHIYGQMRYLDHPLPLMLGRSYLIQRTGRDLCRKSDEQHKKKISRAWKYPSKYARPVYGYGYLHDEQSPLRNRSKPNSTSDPHRSCHSGRQPQNFAYPRLRSEKLTALESYHQSFQAPIILPSPTLGARSYRIH